MYLKTHGSPTKNDSLLVATVTAQDAKVGGERFLDLMLAFIGLLPGRPSQKLKKSPEGVGFFSGWSTGFLLKISIGIGIGSLVIQASQVLNTFW